MEIYENFKFTSLNKTWTDEIIRDFEWLWPLL